MNLWKISVQKKWTDWLTFKVEAKLKLLRPNFYRTTRTIKVEEKIVIIIPLLAEIPNDQSGKHHPEKITLIHTRHLCPWTGRYMQNNALVINLNISGYIPYKEVFAKKIEAEVNCQLVLFWRSMGTHHPKLYSLD